MSNGSQPARPLVVDLFAGAGGLSLGFEQAGFDVVAAVEMDPIHAAVHEFNFPYSTTICADVSRLSGDHIRARSAIGDRELHAVVGGAPCQGFSMIGKRQLDDPRNRLVAEFARLVIELAPRYFVLENVAGLTLGDHRLLLDEAVELFQRNGYRTVLPYSVLQASEFGVPQSRKRLFLIGARDGVPLPRYPTPTHTARRIRGGEVTSHQRLPIGPSVRDALVGLPDADLFPSLVDSDSTDIPAAVVTGYAGVLSGHTLDSSNFGRPRPFSPGRLTSSARTSHLESSVQRFQATDPGATEPISRFLRLHPDGVCNTLRAGTASDRGAHTSPRPIHPEYARVITVREAARLHSYPDWFRFHATKWHGFRQIGNSVPPLLARAVAAEILRADGHSARRGPLTTLGDPRLLAMTSSQAEAYFGLSSRVIPQRERRTAERIA